MENHVLLYKYLPFNDGSLQVIESNTIKFTDPTAFNDPFDCMPVLDSEKFLAWLLNNSEKRNELIKKFGSSAKLLQKKSVLKKEIIDSSDSFVADLQKKVGVLCLSEDPLSILMWSHYADNHKGFVVEFKIPVYEYDTPSNKMIDYLLKLIPQKVLYSTKRPKLNILSDRIKMIDDALLTKHIDWSYEKEQRVIDAVRGAGIHKFNANLITSVLTGAKMTPDNKIKLKSLLDKHNKVHSGSIKIYECHRSQNEFKLIVNNHPHIKIITKT
jgi:hypothetical protein